MTDQQQRPDWQCPFCGKRMCRCEISTSSGVRAISLCCDIPLEFVDNFDVFSGLPENLRQIAIERKKDEYAAMDERDAELAKDFKESRDRWLASHPELFHGTVLSVPMHE